MAPGDNATYILLSTWHRSFWRNAEGDSPAFGRRSNLITSSLTETGTVPGAHGWRSPTAAV